MTRLVCALLVDLDDSADFPGSEAVVMGRPMAAYPLMAARTSAHVRRIYAVTGSPPVKAAALQYGAIIIDPPAGRPALESYLQHGFRQITSDLAREGAGLELLVLLFPNALAVTKDMIDAGVEALLDRPELDSAQSVRPLERWSPAMTRRQNSEGLLDSFLPAGCGPFPADRPWHPTWGVTVLRPQMLESPPKDGVFPWLGHKILPIKAWGPGMLDFHWQIPGLEYWLKKNGVPDLSPNLERQPLPKPQLSPKNDRR